MPRCAITVDKNVHFDLQGVHVASARENANSRRVQVSVKIFRSIITTRFGKHGSRRLTLCRNFQNRRAADGHWNGNFIVMEFFVFEDFFCSFLSASKLFSWQGSSFQVLNRLPFFFVALIRHHLSLHKFFWNVFRWNRIEPANYLPSAESKFPFSKRQIASSLRVEFPKIFSTSARHVITRHICEAFDRYWELRRIYRFLHIRPFFNFLCQWHTTVDGASIISCPKMQTYRFNNSCGK